MTARADHDDRDRCGGGIELELVEGAESVEVRHEHIHDDEIRVGGAGELERLPAIAGLEKFEAALLEAEFLDAEHVGLVIHDQDFRGEFIHGSGAGSGRERSSPSRSRVRSSCAVSPSATGRWSSRRRVRVCSMGSSVRADDWRIWRSGSMPTWAPSALRASDTPSV